MLPWARPNSTKSAHCRPVYRPTTRVATDPTTTTMMTAMRKAQRNRSTKETRRIRLQGIAHPRELLKSRGMNRRRSPPPIHPPGHLVNQRNRSGLADWVHLLRILPRLPGRGIRAHDLVHGDVRIGAIAVLVACDCPREALVPLGGEEGVPKGLPADVHRPALRLGDILDRGEEDHRRIVGVGVESGRRLLAVLLLVL